MWNNGWRCQVLSSVILQDASTWPLTSCRRLIPAAAMDPSDVEACYPLAPSGDELRVFRAPPQNHHEGELFNPPIIPAIKP